MDSIHHRARAFLQNLDYMSATELHDAFINEVLETFGRFDAPVSDTSHLWELELHGITANGDTAAGAIANWKRLACKKHLAPEQQTAGAA